MNALHTFPERIAVKSVTFALTPVAILIVAMALIFEGRFTESVSWVFGDWRDPL
ncbi:hypothetical protein [Haladaptatus halobius]|uniref:hypothetical protein n=1 Tax=Haladaptatus halobius TaxID=2884875 RepID=UPI001D09D26B|nr:hypothetical protein [Haladaptatus halobius]